MRRLLIIFMTVFTLEVVAQTETPTGISLNTPWKISLEAFAKKNVVHPSWGYSHSERNYHNTKLISEVEKLGIDDDVLLAAAFLHDIGGMPAFEKEGVDHGIRSAEVGIPLLRTWGFPEEKLSLVEEIIIGHVYYGPQPIHPWARAFRDADILDFLGSVGVSRILAATNELGKYPTIANAVKTLETMMNKLPQELFYSSSKNESLKRIRETKSFLKGLKNYSFDGKAY